jgi:hypothetical protein
MKRPDVYCHTEIAPFSLLVCGHNSTKNSLLDFGRNWHSRKLSAKNILGLAGGCQTALAAERLSGDAVDYELPRRQRSDGVSGTL